MDKSIDLDMIRKMEGPKPERWIPVLCDEIERMQHNHTIALESRDQQIRDLRERHQDLVDEIGKLIVAHSQKLHRL